MDNNTSRFMVLDDDGPLASRTLDFDGNTHQVANVVSTWWSDLRMESLLVVRTPRIAELAL
ncbi:hypothetical protein [Archangium sp.]|uniref:hypothetical protein n=1 Tax=Archangium sp. TaxID=1872627 RepID=UPI00389ABB05